MSKTYIISKTLKVIRSCKTKEQLIVAENFAHNASRQLSKKYNDRVYGMLNELRWYMLFAQEIIKQKLSC